MAGIFPWMQGQTKAAPKQQQQQQQQKQAAPASQQQQQQQQSTEPLAQFADMFQKLQEQMTAQATTKPGLPQLDPKQLQEAIGKTRVAPQFSAAHIEAIKAGGDEAVAAMSELMNQAAQAAVVQSILASQRIGSAAAEVATSSVTGQLPQMLRDQMFQQQLYATMPNLKNPAVEPIVEAVRAGIAASNPTLTPEQLTEQAVQYFQGLGSSVAPAPAGTATDAPAETDFMSLFGITAPAAPTAAGDTAAT